MSHVLADGMALLDFTLSILDPGPRTPAPPTAPSEQATSAPNPVALLAAATIGRSRRRVSAGLRAVDGLRRPGKVLSGGVALAKAAVTVQPAPQSPLSRPVGPRRDLTWLRRPMAELQQMKRAQGVSLNDVVLAAVAGALRNVPDAALSPADRRHPRALVPVSTHGPDAGHEVENRFSMLLADLPVSIDDPLDRLRSVHAQMVRRKQSVQMSIGSLLFTVSDLVPGRLLRLVAPWILRRQPAVNLAVTNMPGTSQPLYLLGSRLREVYPFVTLVGNIAVIVGVISYGDSLHIGITVDPDVVDDPDGLTDALDRSFAELVRASAS